MKRLFIVLLVCIFITQTLLISFAKPIISDQKWILSGAGRSIYLFKLDGSDKEIIFDNVGETNSQIEVLTNSYNGKIILCKVVNMGKFSYWLVDLDKNEQYPVIEDLLFRPSNTLISTYGNLVSFTTTEKNTTQIWLYDVRNKTLKEFGENVTDGIVRFVRFSYDENYALYIKLTGDRPDYYQILCLRDFKKNRDYDLTIREDGIIVLGDFYFDNENIILARILPTDNFNSLWDFNIKSKRFTYVTELKGENISAVSTSRDGNQIAICTSNPSRPGMYFFWTLKRKGFSNLTFINQIPVGMIGIRLSHDGEYLLYSTENSPTYIASLNGSINEELNDLIPLPNLKDANWYNHPPFPPKAKASINGNLNIISWEPSISGTYPIAGYKIYRSNFPDKKNLTILNTLTNIDISYIDNNANPKTNYYYLVRSFDEDGTESIPSNEVLIDRTLPIISFTKPEPYAWFKDEQVRVEGIVRDLESGVDRVIRELFI